MNESRRAHFRVTCAPAGAWRELYEEVWPILLAERPSGVPERRATIQAKRRAAELVEGIRVSTRQIITELSLSAIEADGITPDQLRDRIMNSPAFSCRLGDYAGQEGNRPRGQTRPARGTGLLIQAEISFVRYGS
jgi:hypothetical protein